MRSLELLVLVLGTLVAVSRAGPPILSLVPVECGRYFTWQSLGIFYSHRKVGQPGKIIRVSCCTPEDAEKYADILQIVPTWVAPSYTVHPRTGDVYSAYNKPLAVLDYLSKNHVEEEYILVIDADMVFVQKFDPISMGVRPGWATSAFFGYMKGVYNELALKHVPEVLPRNDSLAGPPGRRGDMCGGFTFMMRDDLARVAPLWLKYTEDVRFDEDAWKLSGDQYAIHPGDKPWISEMYGYAYGCAKADVWHVAARTAMEYPEYNLVEPPMVMHYGLLFDVPNTGYQYDKHWYYDFDATACPPWGMQEGKRSMRGLFNHPPMPASLKSTGIELMRDLYAIETVNTLNEAFCERHYMNCFPSEELDKECAKVHLISEQVNQGLAYLERQGTGRCDDGDPRCPLWSTAGECEKNPYYMLSVCRAACHQCSQRASNVHLSDYNHAAWEDRFMQGDAGAADKQQKQAADQVLTTGDDARHEPVLPTEEDAAPGIDPGTDKAAEVSDALVNQDDAAAAEVEAANAGGQGQQQQQTDVQRLAAEQQAAEQAASSGDSAVDGQQEEQPAVLATAGTVNQANAAPGQQQQVLQLRATQQQQQAKQQPKEVAQLNAVQQPNEVEKPNVVQQPNEVEKPNVVQQPNEMEKPNEVEKPNAVQQAQATQQEVAQPNAVQQAQATQQEAAQPKVVQQPQTTQQQVAQPKVVQQPQATQQEAVQPKAVQQPQATQQEVAQATQQQAHAIPENVHHDTPADVGAAAQQAEQQAAYHAAALKQQPQQKTQQQEGTKVADEVPTVVVDEVPALVKQQHAEPVPDDATTWQQQQRKDRQQQQLLEDGTSGGGGNGEAARRALQEQQEQADAGGGGKHVEHVLRLKAKCSADTGLTPLQLEDCLSAATHGIEYFKPKGKAGASGQQGRAGAVPLPNQDVGDDLGHGKGLMQHAAGGLGFMVWCGIGLLIFVLRPRCGATPSSRRRGGHQPTMPAVRRSLPL